MAYPNVASVATESFTPTNDIAGDITVTTQVVTVLSGQVLSYLQVLGRVTASGKLVAHAPAAADGSQIAVALAAYPVDATGADVQAEVITAGTFSMQSVVVNAATNTDARKQSLFPLGGPIVIKKRIFGAA